MNTNKMYKEEVVGLSLHLTHEEVQQVTHEIFWMTERETHPRLWAVYDALNGGRTG